MTVIQYLDAHVAVGGETVPVSNEDQWQTGMGFFKD